MKKGDEITVYAVSGWGTEAAVESTTAVVRGKTARLHKSGAGFGYRTVIQVDELDLTPGAAIERFAAPLEADAARLLERARRVRALRDDGGEP